ncbi:Ribonuclease E inhibitor RraA [hydrothermal vent metagenome]|uniref:Oxaloacetate decarboxylase n=1 Tax=hydrothermal vent metagenome TaxID=652676 RepID=A0A1W1C5G1_9ZZZZ
MSFSTADLCDKYGESVAVLETNLNSYGGKTSFFGEMVTIKLDEDNGDLVTMLRDEKGNGRVVVVDVEANYCAVVGDTLMGFAKKNGWSGIVINGFVRDIKITKTISVGLMALGTCPRKSPKKSPSQLGIELNFGGVDFKRGAYLYADEDGVIVSDNILK